LLVAHQQQHDVDADWMGPQNAHVREYGSSWSMLHQQEEGAVLIFQQRTLTFFTTKKNKENRKDKEAAAGGSNNNIIIIVDTNLWNQELVEQVEPVPAQVSILLVELSSSSGEDTLMSAGRGGATGLFLGGEDGEMTRQPDCDSSSRCLYLMN
jgi:hypothetical protein